MQLYFDPGAFDLENKVWPPFPNLVDMQAKNMRFVYRNNEAFEDYVHLGELRIEQMPPEVRCIAVGILLEMLMEIDLIRILDEIEVSYETERQRMESLGGATYAPFPNPEDILESLGDALRSCSRLPYEVDQWLQDMDDYVIPNEWELQAMTFLHSAASLAAGQGQLPENFENPETGTYMWSGPSMLMLGAIQYYLLWMQRETEGVSAPPSWPHANFPVSRWLGPKLWEAYLAWVFLEEWRRRTMQALAVREGLELF